MGCFESKYEILYNDYIIKSKINKSKHLCSEEFKEYLKINSLDAEYYSVAYKSNNSCLCELYIKCFICNKKHINFNTIYCSLCNKCTINNLYYHCYNCNKCKPILINHCEAS